MCSIACMLHCGLGPLLPRDDVRGLLAAIQPVCSCTRRQQHCADKVFAEMSMMLQNQDVYDSLPEPTDDENDMLDLAFGLTET